MIKSFEELIELVKKKKSFKFKIKVSANARSNSIDFCCDFIKIKITAPAIEGKANKAIVDYLSDKIKVAKSNIKILNGEKSNIKTIGIEF